MNFLRLFQSKVVSYKDYWESVRPKNHDDIFRRYLFSFMSVHTTWKSNVSGYNAIKNFNDWMDDKETLERKLKIVVVDSIIIGQSLFGILKISFGQIPRISILRLKRGM
jgi:hypothetical protein